MELTNRACDKSFSNLSFLWIFTFSWREIFKRSPIIVYRLPYLPPTYDAHFLYHQFSRYWKEELKRKSPRMWLALLRTFGLMFKFNIFLALIYLTLEFSLVILLNWLIRAIEDTENYVTWHLLAIAGLVTICAILARFLGNTMEYELQIIGMKCRILLTNAIYQKIQASSSSQVQRLSFGNILTVITSDLFKFDEMLSFAIYLIIAPIGIMLTIGFSCILLGWPASLMLVMFVIHLIIELGIGNEINRRYKRALEYSDLRNKHLREFIEGIQLIKSFAWEYVIANALNKIRKEFFQIQANYFFKSLGVTLCLAFPTLYILAVCLSIYATIGGDFSASQVFGFLALCMVYSRNSTHFNQSIAGIAELNVCIKRTQNILLFEKGNEFHHTNIVSDIAVAVKTSQLTSRRMDSNTRHTVQVLQDISFSLKRGEILSIIGKVGSGKSTLLLSLLNEIEFSEGTVEMSGSCAFVPQEAWIVPCSVRENITYGKMWDGEWYDQVLTACCLNVDMKQLGEGDLTIVGERGITLSGGQKARISLARAIYADCDIYLLDDPLSSVDTAVAQQILSTFTTGLLSGKTAILVTHQLQFILQTDIVMLIENGKVVEYGENFLVKNLNYLKVSLCIKRFRRGPK